MEGMSEHPTTPEAADEASSESQRASQSATPPSATTQTVYQVRRRVVRIGLPDGWLRGLLAGIQAALMGWALVATIVLVSYAVVANNPWMSETTWADAAAAGAAGWAMSLGGSVLIPGPTEGAQTVIRAIPLLVTLLSIVSLRVFLRGARHFQVSSTLLAIPAFVGVSALLISANHAVVEWTSTLIGATIISTISVAWALIVDRRSDVAPTLTERWCGRFAGAVSTGLAAARRLVGVLALTSAVVLVIATILRWEQIAGIAELLGPETTTDATMLTIVQSLYGPNAMVWILAWGSGAGVLIGPDTFHSIGQAVVAPIPPIPLLGLLPGSAPGYGWIAMPVLLALTLGAAWGRYGAAQTLLDDVLTALTLIITTAAAVSVWMFASTLTLGAERLSYMGPVVTGATLMVISLTALPLSVGYILARPEFLALLSGARRRTVELSQRVRARDEAPAPDAQPETSPTSADADEADEAPQASSEHTHATVTEETPIEEAPALTDTQPQTTPEAQTNTPTKTTLTPRGVSQVRTETHTTAGSDTVGASTTADQADTPTRPLPSDEEDDEGFPPTRPILGNDPAQEGHS